MRRTGDLGLLPEREMLRRAEGSTPYEIAPDPGKNPVGALLEAARRANARDPAGAAALAGLLEESDPALRWWGAVGLAALGRGAAPAAGALRRAIREDESWDVRLAAAEAGT